MPARRAGTASPNASRREGAAARRVDLGVDLRIARAAEVFAGLSAARRGAVVKLAAAGVAKIDTAGLQALAVAAARWRDAGVSWSWEEPSEVLRSAARLSGLAAHLDLA